MWIPETGASRRQARLSGRRCKYIPVRLTKTSLFSTLPESLACLLPMILVSFFSLIGRGPGELFLQGKGG